MDRPEWYSKLIYIALTVALVLSLIGIAVLSPVLAENGVDLGVTVTTDKDFYCVCNNITVTANITNSGDETAQNVTANITWTGNAIWVSGGDVGSPPYTINVGNISVNSSASPVWVLHCNDLGAVNITVESKENRAAGGNATGSGYKVVNQVNVGSDLTVTISEPEEGSEFGVCTNFTLTFNVTNTGNITAYHVNARVDPSANVEGYDQYGQAYGGGASFSVATLEELAPNATHQWTVNMHCAGCDAPGYESSIHVMPMGDDGCTGTEMQSQYLHSDIRHFYQKFGVTCDAEPNPTKVCHNVTFTATLDECAEYPVSWNWTFDDGNSTAGNASSSPFTTTHHYNATNNYTAVVNVVDDLGITGTCNVTVEVLPTLNVTCAVTPFDFTKVCHNLTFTGNATGGFPAEMCNYTWTWNFSDGTTFNGTGKSPIVATHHYNATGNYTVTLTLMDDCLNNTANCTVDVEVFPALNVSCNVSSNVTKVCHYVTFNGTAVGGIPQGHRECSYNWTWDLDDGTVVTGDGYSGGVSHHYNATGNYTAIFVIEDNCWNNTASCNVTVKVFPGLNLTCDAEPRIVHVCQAVNFTANLTGGVPGSNFTWNWTFGDSHATPSNPNTSTAQNSSHIYMCVGNYTANVTVCDDLEPANCANCTVNVTVIIEPPELISPPNMSQLTSKNVTFEWEDIGCCNYTLEIWQKEAGGEQVWEVETGHDNQWTGCIFDGNWRWFVTATDACNNTAPSVTWYFQMDAPEPSVTVQSPNGGETLACNSTTSITWTATPTDATIEILYSSDGGGTWTQVASGEVNDGAYPWTVPCISSEQCLVRLIARDACQGEGADTSDGAFTITTEPAPVTSYNITLAAGWNLISPPLIPTNSTIEAVTVGINTTVAIIWHYDASTATWLWYVPGNPASTLTTMEDGKGYWVSMNSADSLLIVGKMLPTPPTLPPTYNVVYGWNLIGFKSTVSLHHSAYLFNLYSGGFPNYSAVYGYDASVPAYVFVFPLEQNSGNLEPGHGYWLWATAAGVIVPIS